MYVESHGIGSSSFYLLVLFSMAETFEYPPAFVHHHPLDYKRAGVHPLLFWLHHHFFLTQLKVVLKAVLCKEYTPFLLDGIESEVVSVSLQIIDPITQQ